MAKEAREESMVGGARAEPPAGISAVKGGREEPWWHLTGGNRTTDGGGDPGRAEKTR